MTGLNLAFYGRLSTEDLQDERTSRAWQRENAEQLVAGKGEIVCEFFDVGVSRSWPWTRRPEAVAMVAEMARKDRRFDAVVIGEASRAFYGGRQIEDAIDICRHYGVGLWCPETSGPVDFDGDGHRIILAIGGEMSAGERRKIQKRVKAGMTAIAKHGGRFLGGRPPFGYRIVHGDLHPNQGKARQGIHMTLLEPDPATAPTVRRIYADYLRGKGLRLMADELTAEGVPSPSAYDPDRNKHRQASCGAWSRAALRAILTNPTYTGHRVWGRARRKEVLRDPGNPGQGHRSAMVWNDPTDWVWPEEATHEAIIDMATWEAAKDRMNARRGGRGPREVAKGRRPYALRGLVHCEVCDAYVAEGRRLEGATIDGRTYYRCRLQGDDYGRSEALEIDHPKAAYLPEKKILPALVDWLARLGDPDHIDETADRLALAARDETGEAQRAAEADVWRRRVIDADDKIAKYQALALTAPPEIVGPWLVDAKRDRDHAQAELDRLAPAPPTNIADLKALLAGLADIRERLSLADPDLLRAVFVELGVRVTWRPRADHATVEIRPTGANAGVGETIGSVSIRDIVQFAA